MAVLCSNLRVVTEVAKSLYFSPKLHALADRVIKGMATAEGKDEFNAVHLRIEKDARDWSTIMGGEAVSLGAGFAPAWPDCFVMHSRCTCLKSDSGFCRKGASCRRQFCSASTESASCKGQTAGVHL